MTESFDYSLFGLHLRSELSLPDLIPVDLTSEPHVHVRYGTVAEAASDGLCATDGLCAIDGGVQLEIDNLARYAVIGGSQIIIERLSDAPDVNVRLYLLGSIMGILLHQRGVLPLHANAVEIGGKAFAFAGKSGAGKSTLAAGFHDHGYTIIADDICAVSFDANQQPFVAPGLPRLRLWREALEASGRDAALFELSYANDDNWDKFDVPLPRETAKRTTTELGGIYLLEKGDAFAINQLQGIEAADAIFANTYRGGYVNAAGNVQKYWQACVQLATYTPIFRITRRWDLAFLDEDISRLVAHVQDPSHDIGT